MNAPSPQPFTSPAPAQPPAINSASTFDDKLDAMVASGQLTPALKDQVRERIILGQSSKKLTDEQVGKALSVIEGVNNPALIDKFLKSGGLALLAKLDGLPEAYRDEIVKQIGEGNLYFCGLSKALDEYHASPAGPDRDAKIEGFIEAVKQMRSASAVQKALDSGKGMAGVIQAAGGVSSGISGQPIPLGTATTGSFYQSSFTSGVPAMPQVDLSQRLADFFANNSGAKKSNYVLISEAVLTFAEAIRQEQIKAKKQEEQIAETNPFTLGSDATLKDLKEALKTIVSKYGSLNNAIPLIESLIQTSFRGDPLGQNISVEKVLEVAPSVLHSWLNALEISGSTGEGFSIPPITTQPLHQSPSPQPPTAQPPAPSLAESGPLNTNSHQA